MHLYNFSNWKIRPRHVEKKETKNSVVLLKSIIECSSNQSVNVNKQIIIRCVSLNNKYKVASATCIAVRTDNMNT